MERQDVCGLLWEESIDYGTNWLDAYESSKDPRDAELKDAIARMKATGVSPDDLVLLAESARYEATFATLRVLSEKECLTDTYDCLYEDLLTSKP